MSQRMKQDVITLKDLSSNANISIGYSDDDIVMIDSVKNLAAPPKARLDMNSLVLITNGKVKARIDNEELDFFANQLVICPPNLGLYDIMSSPDFEFKGVFFTNRILQSFLREKLSVWDDMVYSHHVRVFNLSEDHKNFYRLFIEMLWNCLEKGRRNPYFNEIIQNLFRTAFLGLSGELKLMMSREEPQDDGKSYDKLFRQFLNLLSGINIKHRNTSYYADKLYVSPKYLSAVCKKNSGKTATEWINERLKEEVRFNLEETDISIKQICYNLGFSSPSFFGKYVRANFGQTPLQIRNNIRK